MVLCARSQTIMASGISEARYFLFAENKFGFILFSRAPLDRLTGADEYKISKIPLLLLQMLLHLHQDFFSTTNDFDSDRDNGKVGSNREELEDSFLKPGTTMSSRHHIFK